MRPEARAPPTVQRARRHPIGSADARRTAGRRWSWGGDAERGGVAVVTVEEALTALAGRVQGTLGEGPREGPGGASGHEVQGRVRAALLGTTPGEGPECESGRAVGPHLARCNLVAPRRRVDGHLVVLADGDLFGRPERGGAALGKLGRAGQLRDVPRHPRALAQSRLVKEAEREACEQR
eukprot:471032-Prymnesium_polylepis.1